MNFDQWFEETGRFLLAGSSFKDAMEGAFTAGTSPTQGADARPVAWATKLPSGNLSSVRPSLKGAEKRTDAWNERFPNPPHAVTVALCECATRNAAPSAEQLVLEKVIALFEDMESTERLAPGFVIQKVRSFMDPVTALLGSARDDEPRNVEGMTRAEFESHLRVCYQYDNVRAHVNASEGFRLTDEQERNVSVRVELNYPPIIPCPGCDAWNSGMAEVNFVQGCQVCARNMRRANGLDDAAIESQRSGDGS